MCLRCQCPLILYQVVILATGFRRTLPFLPPEMVQKIVQPPDMQLKLYHVSYPYALGRAPLSVHSAFAAQGSSLFIMWNVGFLTCLQSDVAARWALEMVEGRIRKNTEEMDEYVRQLYEWADKNFDPAAALDIKRGCTAPYTYDYVDDMLKMYLMPCPAGLYGKVMASIGAPPQLDGRPDKRDADAGM
ncbi:hypothetical protein GPECTOR_1g602 [Gonium pectorale]|uniref:Flavin-containing monooxygenase n=1 Tax=Gonium pectorale TaxID=33097 RepID=A0A150H3E3_GONPE|nr:hypothetical protein GPECTOR_1g602 [Gonium pectorale]|eukprot:KXZ56669.1 hypothetical protein GPECTOR_1g602 [Gonium pectorale]